MSVLDQLDKSNLSLDGPRGFANRKFGYEPAPSPIEAGTPTALHRDYSALNNPGVITARNFNGTSFNKPSSTLDETDPNAPNNYAAGAAGSVVSQIYKSTQGQNYKDKGPDGGRF